MAIRTQKCAIYRCILSKTGHHELGGVDGDEASLLPKKSVNIEAFLVAC